MAEKVVRLKPSDINISQPRGPGKAAIDNRCKEDLEKLIEGEMAVDDIESIEVYTHQGKYFTKEIGRLKMFQELERRKRKVTIPVIVKDKATTKTEGESVKSIRRKQQEGSQPGQEGPKPGISKLKRRKEREHSRERKRQRSDPWSQDV